MPSHRNHAGVLALATVGAMIALAPAAQEASEADRLRDLEQAIHEGRDRRESLEADAARAEVELSALRGGLISAAASAREREAEVTQLERRLESLEAEERAKSVDLARQRAALTATLGALMRLSRRPTEALIAMPVAAVDTVRTSKLLAATIPILVDEADALGAEVEVAKRLREEIVAEQHQLARALTALGKEQQLIRRLLDRKSTMRHRARAEVVTVEQRLRRMAAEAEDLRALVSSLAAPAPPVVSGDIAVAPEQRMPFSANRGAMPTPVQGRLMAQFGELNELGIRARGVSIEARPSAQVVAPHDGHVVFAGTFRSYGRLLIIAHGEGYHTLLAGLDRIDCEVGQWVLAGEPVGQMSDREKKPVLYVEVRREGEPVNPLAWLAEGGWLSNGAWLSQDDDKVSG